MKIDMNVLAEILANKISENIKVEVEFKDGKAVAQLKHNEDYMRGITDTIDALASLNVSVFD